jgi:hypothetical protein
MHDHIRQVSKPLTVFLKIDPPFKPGADLACGEGR